PPESPNHQNQPEPPSEPEPERCGRPERRERFSAIMNTTTSATAIMTMSSSIRVVGLTNQAQARGTNQREPRSGTEGATPRCLQRFVRSRGHNALRQSIRSSRQSHCKPSTVISSSSLSGGSIHALNRQPAASSNCSNVTPRERH